METKQKTTLNRTYFTFNVKHYYEPHPCGGSVRPDGWWEVRNASTADAISIVQVLTGGEYECAYRLEDFNPDHYPAGPTRVIDIRDRS